MRLVIPSAARNLLFFPMTPAWQPAPQARWAHSAPQPCASLPCVSLSPAPSPSSSAPISHEEYFLLGGGGILRCCGVLRLLSGAPGSGGRGRFWSFRVRGRRWWLLLCRLHRGNAARDFFSFRNRGHPR